MLMHLAGQHYKKPVSRNRLCELSSCNCLRTKTFGTAIGPAMADTTPEEHQLFMTAKEPACQSEETVDDLTACTIGDLDEILSFRKPDYIDAMSTDELKESLREITKRAQRLTLAVTDLRFEHQRLYVHIKGIRGLHQLEMDCLIEQLVLARRSTVNAPSTVSQSQDVSDHKHGLDSTTAATAPVPQLPVFFRDHLNREFKFPYDRCCKWRMLLHHGLSSPFI